MSRITSRQHPIVRQCRELAARREDSGRVLLEGEHLVIEALDARVAVEVLLVEHAGGAVARRAAAAGADVHEVTTAVMAAASPVRTPSGVLAIGRWQARTTGELLAASDLVDLLIGLVDVQDPGNLGGVIRSADALGASGVAALGASADPGGWKALRGSMGAAFRLPVARGDAGGLVSAAQARGVRVAATASAGGDPLDAADLTGPLLILLGNEGAGLPDDLLGAADVRLTIPMRRGADSLNVAVSAALILWEARRQRQSEPRRSR